MFFQRLQVPVGCCGGTITRLGRISRDFITGDMIGCDGDGEFCRSYRLLHALSQKNETYRAARTLHTSDRDARRLHCIRTSTALLAV